MPVLTTDLSLDSDNDVSKSVDAARRRRKFVSVSSLEELKEKRASYIFCYIFIGLGESGREKTKENIIPRGKFRLVENGI